METFLKYLEQFMQYTGTDILFCAMMYYFMIAVPFFSKSDKRFIGKVRPDSVSFSGYVVIFILSIGTVLYANSRHGGLYNFIEYLSSLTK